MKSKIHYIIIFIFVFSLSCKNNHKDIEDNEINDFELLVEKQIESCTKENSNKYITSQYVYFGVDSMNKKKIDYLIGKHRFFFYFTEQTCSPCILSTIDCMKEVFPNYEQDDAIIFVCPDCPLRLKSNCYGKKVLTLEKEKLGIPLEDIHVPFIFTLNNELKIKELHIINKNDFTKTIDFLKHIHD